MTEPEYKSRNMLPMAAGFEASLALVGIGLGWLLDTHPLASLTWDPVALYWGLAATLPLFGLLGLIVFLPWRPFQQILTVVDELIEAVFRDASLFGLAMIALMAGIGEELLFRGVVQSALANWTGSPLAALLAAGVLFGLLHAVTRAYVVMATIVGIYLGILWLATGNLLAPVIAHAVYDFGALWYLQRTSARRAESWPR